MKAYEIMTREVITVRPETTIQHAAEVMVTYEISGLPVVDDTGRVVGILSEGDLIVRQRGPKGRSWWHRFFEDGEQLARDYQKRIGTTVGEVMTRSVLCISPETPIESVAIILDERRIRRVPVVAEDRLVGIVSRGDLVKALTNVAAPASTEPRSDSGLVREMRERVARERWAHAIVVEARNGVLSLWGLVDSEAEKSALETMARAIEGAKGVTSSLVVRPAGPYRYWT